MKAMILRLVLAFFLTVVSLQYAIHHWDPEEAPQIYDIEIDDREFVPDATTLLITGTGLFRVNTFHVDGKKVPVLHFEAKGYSGCYVVVRKDVFVKDEEYGIQIGKTYPFPLGELYRSNTFFFYLDE